MKRLPLLGWLLVLGCGSGPGSPPSANDTTAEVATADVTAKVEVVDTLEHDLSSASDLEMTSDVDEQDALTDTMSNSDVAQPSLDGDIALGAEVLDTAAPPDGQGPDGGPVDVPVLDVLAPDSALPDVPNTDSSETVGGNDADEVDSSSDGPDVPPPDGQGGTDVYVPGTVAVPTCDAGDQAWIRAVMPLLLGRRPSGQREMTALSWQIDKVGRTAVAKAMMQHPDFLLLWSDRLFDLWGMPAQTTPFGRTCMGKRLQPGDTGQLAALVRDAKATSPVLSQPSTVRDLAWSSLQLGDVSPFVRASVFLRLLEPNGFCGNPTPAQTSAARRLTFGRSFMANYLNRQMDCLGCHNSQFAVNDSQDPAEDRHWPVPGQFETALFGSPIGRPEPEVYAFFRYRGFVSKAYVTTELESQFTPEDNAPAIHPWGLATMCGGFMPPGSILPDPLPDLPWLTGPLQAPASLWDLDEILRVGMATAAAYPDVQDTEGLSLDGKRSVGWLVAANLAERVWQVSLGHRLTLGHGFPRNTWQRDKLQALTAVLLQNNWSLQALLTAVVTDPWFNQLPPAAGCGPGPYAGVPLLDPFVVQEQDPALRGHSGGDSLLPLRHDALVAATAYATATSRPVTSAYPNGILQAQPLTYLAIGPLDQPPRPLVTTMTPELHLVWQLTTLSGGLGQSLIGDSVSPANPLVGDLVDQVVTLAQANTGVTLHDAVSALRDRIWLDAAVPDAEQVVLQQLFGVTSLNQSAALAPNLEDGLRAYSSVLLGGPRWTHVGLAWPDAAEAPALILDGKQTQDHCVYWSTWIWPTGGATCTATGLVVQN